jgi:hypothetical protein
MKMGRGNRRWVDNIKMNLREIGWMQWTGLMWLRIGISRWLCEHGNELSGTITCWEILE